MPEVPGEIDCCHAAGTDLLLEQISLAQGRRETLGDGTHGTGESKPSLRNLRCT
jgi:hypothetical protein